jgi:hypothetical protein
LPLDCASRAIDAGVAVEMNSPMRNKMTHNQSPGMPSAAMCHSLDAPGTATADTVDEQQHDAVLHSFVENVGQPYQLRVAR